MTDTASSSPSAPASFPYIDHDVRPQDDLQRHVNGEWLKTAEIPADMDAYGSFHELRDRAEADVRQILEHTAAGNLEAAELDGANWFQRFRAITVSIIRPEIFVVTLTCAIAALKVTAAEKIDLFGADGKAKLY